MKTDFCLGRCEDPADNHSRLHPANRRTFCGFAAKLVGGLVLFSMLQGIPSADAKVTLVFGVYTSEKPSAMVKQMRPSLKALSKAATEVLGEEVEIKLDVVKTYLEGRAGLLSGRFDFMRLGPASYVLAKNEKPGLRLLAIENKKGSKKTNGIICVKADSHITSLDQLRGRLFAFGNKRSTLGRYVAQQALVDAGVVARGLARYEYLGRHDKVGRAVAAGTFDAGALSESTFKKLVKKGVQIRAIAKFPAPTKPWVAREGMSSRIAQALTQALLSLDDPKALKALRANGFMAVTDREFDGVRKAIRNNQRFFEGIG
ncbi:MAG: PhnD/SsuA/transferrin family substrate-binding protein [Rhodospirillales bacterium]|nr:PhnD/SsuA/transferrin family substrate-binding protein [Rhodospirillales bacterium]